MCEHDGCPEVVDKDGLCFRHKLLTVRTNGMTALKAQREAGLTERQINAENHRMFKANPKNKDKELIRADGKNRWI